MGRGPRDPASSLACRACHIRPGRPPFRWTRGRILRYRSRTPSRPRQGSSDRVGDRRGRDRGSVRPRRSSPRRTEAGRHAARRASPAPSLGLRRRCGGMERENRGRTLRRTSSDGLSGDTPADCSLKPLRLPSNVALFEPVVVMASDNDEVVAQRFAVERVVGGSDLFADHRGSSSVPVRHGQRHVQD